MQEVNGIRYYGWNGTVAENPKRCIAEVISTCFQNYQCQLPRGKGPDGLYCGTHDPSAYKARAEKREKAYQAEREVQKRKTDDRLVGQRLRIVNKELYLELLADDDD